MDGANECHREEKWKLVKGKNQLSSDFKTSMQVYKDWAKTYVEDYMGIGYQGHVNAAKYLAKYNANKNSKILDIAAGTGLCAKELRNHGFTNIDALEPCYEMLESARNEGLYQSYLWAAVGEGRMAPVLDDSYDHVTMAGAVGLVRNDAFLDMIRITKPGGYIVISSREENPHKNPDCAGLIETFQQHVDDGYWEKVEEVVTPKYYMDLDAITWVFRVTKTQPVGGQRSLLRIE